MKLAYYSYLFLLLGVICFATYYFIGSTILPDGTLKEPFFLLPLGYLFSSTGIIIGVISLVRSWFKK